MGAYGFPGGPVVKNPPCKGHQFDSWSGKIPHASEQLSPRTPQPLKPVCPRARAPQQDK